MKKSRISISQKQLAVLSVVVLAVSLIPMLVIAFYNHPSWDDFNYSPLVKSAIEDGGGVFSVISAAAKQVKNHYYEWQGTYSAIFLFALQPAVFGEGFYALSTFILLFALIFCVSVFMKILCTDLLKMSKSNTVTVTCVLLFLCIQCVLSPVQAFFWYNGSMFYTFFFSIMLLLFAGILRELFIKEGKYFIVKIECTLLAIIIAGSNYATALLSAVVLFVTAAYVAICRKKHSLNQRLWVYITFVLFIVGFIISMTAPGNDVRQAYFTDRPGAVMAVVNAINYALKFSFEWLCNPIIIFALIFITPILIFTASKLDFSFKFPILAPVTAIILIAIQFTPTSYAQNGTGADRLKNIVFYSYIIMLAGVIFYIGGWISHRLLPQTDWNEVAVKFSRAKLWFIIAVAFLCLAFLNADRSYIKNTTSVSAFISLKNGEAQSYDKQINERLKLLNDPDVKNVVLEPLKDKPYCLFWSDMNSGRVAEYYNKESVTLK